MATLKMLFFSEKNMAGCNRGVCCIELKTAVLIIGVFNLVTLIILRLFVKRAMKKTNIYFPMIPN